jgi:ribosomal protein S18 acetylase RimI-like enzyme
MEVRTLENTDRQVILKAFNAAFTDYSVPFHLEASQLDRMLHTANYRPELSAGAFDRDRLVGFILHGVDSIRGKRTAYNCGTGVLPDCRGQSLTAKLYEFILPALRSAGVRKCLLEVIDQNTAAIRSYQRVGFVSGRELDCYRGSIDPTQLQAGPDQLEISLVDTPDMSQMEDFRDWLPAWQNADRTLSQLEKCATRIAFLDGRAVGYIRYGHGSGSVFQFAVDRTCRRQGVGSALFREVAATGKEIALINQDGHDRSTGQFLRSIGLEPYLTQLEMTLELSD